MKPQVHNTFQELNFINGLGRWQEGRTRERKQLLKKYLNAISKRTEWTGIDRDEVRRHLVKLIAELK